MVNGLSYPLTIDTIEHLYLESNYSQPVAVLISVCDEVPDDLLQAYYTPLDLVTTAMTAVLGLAAGLMIYQVVMYALARTKLTGFFADMIQEKGEEAAGKDEEADEEINEEREARTAFFWILQLVIGISFALDYLWTKSPHGTEKTGWPACRCVHFSMLFLYKPLVAPLFICLLNAEHTFCSGKPLVRPRVMISLATITFLLLAVWIYSTLPYLPLVFVNLIIYPVLLIGAGAVMVGLGACLLVLLFTYRLRTGHLFGRVGETVKGDVVDSKVESTESTDFQHWRQKALKALASARNYFESDDVEKEAGEKGCELLKRILVAGFLINAGYLPAMCMLFYKEPSAWGQLQALVWSSCGKLVSDSFDFSLLTWPDLNLDIDFKLSVAVVVLAAERLQALWAYFYYGRRKQRVQASVTAAPEGEAV